MFVMLLESIILTNFWPPKMTPESGKGVDVHLLKPEQRENGKREAMLDGALLCVAKLEEECVEHGFLPDEAQRGVCCALL